MFKINVCFGLLFLLLCGLGCSDSGSSTQVIVQSASSTTDSYEIEITGASLRSKNTIQIYWDDSSVSQNTIEQVDVYYIPPNEYSYKKLDEDINPRVSSVSSSKLLMDGFGTYKVKLQLVLSDFSEVNSAMLDVDFYAYKPVTNQWSYAQDSSDIFKYPEDIVMLSDGSFVVSDRVTNTLYKFSKSGAYLNRFESGFEAPHGLCKKGTDIAVVDTNNNRIVVFDSSESSPSYTAVDYDNANDSTYLVDCTFYRMAHYGLQMFHHNLLLNLIFQKELTK